MIVDLLLESVKSHKSIAQQNGLSPPPSRTKAVFCCIAFGLPFEDAQALLFSYFSSSCQTKRIVNARN
jgi:hypothetical protein